MNMVEKILARKSGQRSVTPGDVVLADVDLMLMHDLSANFVMKVFENEMEGASIADPAKLVFAFDHNFAPATRDAAEALAAVRRFAKKHKVKNLFDSGCGSIHHVVMEAGLVRPGMIVVGCDSHTPIYGALGAFGTGGPPGPDGRWREPPGVSGGRQSSGLRLMGAPSGMRSSWYGAPPPIP